MRSRRVDPIDITHPFWTHYELFGGQPGSFLLDSGHDVGKFSFIGGDPFMVLRAWRRRGHGDATIEVTVHRDIDGKTTCGTTRTIGDPFGTMRELLSRYRSEPHALIPFNSGAVGYIGYEAAHLIESFDDSAQDDLRLPDIHLGFYDHVLIHDHRENRTFVSSDGDDGYERAGGLIARLSMFEPAHDVPHSAVPDIDIVARFDRSAYGALVEQIKAHIAAGDVFEVCLTQRLEAAFDAASWTLYRALRDANPAPFASFIELGDAQIVASSPERFLRLTHDGAAQSQPIKGTRPRGATAEEDDQLRDELAASPKDRAENMMIVDLVRNDLGRVCRFHSVRVDSLMAIERHPTVHQMVSTISGQLRDDKDGIDLLQACFPGGSMTGAPKIEAMKIIDRLEQTCRGIYAGAIGYFDFGGAIDSSIVIRSIVVKGGRAWFGVGGAVVADSDPDDEYDESMLKAQALIAALSAARG